MANIKIVIGTKEGKCVQVEADEDATKKLHGMKLGQSFKGELLNLNGYEFRITGGSDNCGFPMRSDIEGIARRRILSRSDVIGLAKNSRKGYSKRKSVAGNTIGPQTAQINAVVSKAGKEPLPFPKAEEAPAEKKE